MNRFCQVVTLATLLALSQTAVAETLSFSAPTLDRWSYPFAGNGAEQEARIFSALGTEGFSERDAQFVIAFDTSSIPSGLGADQYVIQSLKLTAAVSSLVGAPLYDGTHDTFETYLPDEAPIAAADTDAGRPIELFGAGFAAGYSRFGFGPTDNAPPAFEENNAFGFGPPNGRYVHPLAFDANGDPQLVSDHVDYFNNGADGFDAVPFAVGTSSLPAGAPYTVGTTLTFDVNVADANINEYLRTGLDQGQLGFVISTLSTSDSFTRLFTKEYPGGLPVTLELQYTVVPEPSSVVLLVVTFAALAFVVRTQLRKGVA